MSGHAKPPAEAQHNPSWYAKQLGWAWPLHSGRTWNSLLRIAERKFYENRPRSSKDAA